jgi:hypothetical protein
LKRTVRRGVNPFKRVSSVPDYGFNRRQPAAVMANAEPNDPLVIEMRTAAVQDVAADELLPGLITIDDYLRAFVDVDFVVRCAHQVGIIEARTGSGVKKRIDQLSTAGEPRNLGTYTQKLLVSDQVWDHTLSNLRELAEARRIEVIELPSFAESGHLSAEDAEASRRRVCKVLGRGLKTR